MFDFDLTEEQDMIRTAAADFSRDHLATAFRQVEKTQHIGNATVAAYHDMGLASVEIPENFGGTALAPLDKSLALEALGAGDAAATIALDGIGPAVYPLLEMATPDTAGAVIRETTENPRNRGWVLWDVDHQLTIDNGHVTGHWPWVPANDLTLLVILKDQQAHLLRRGFHCEPTVPCALHAAGSSTLTLNAPVDDTLGPSDHQWKRMIARLRLYAASLQLGIATASLTHASEYTQQRIAFGRPIAHHQGVAFLIAELATEIDAARLACWRAAWTLEQDGDPTEAAAAALITANNIATKAGLEGVQLLGGHGYMKDHPVEKWMRESRTLAQLWGGNDLALHDAAGQLHEVSAFVGFRPPAWTTTQGAS